MLHYLRIAVTALSLTACMLFTALWVRSHSWHDSVWRVSSRPSPELLMHTRFASNSGALSWVHENALYSLSLQVAKRDRWQYDTVTAVKYFPKKFHWHFSSSKRYIAIPHWFAVLVTATIRVITSPLVRWRFTLRTLLIATTLVAVVLWIVLAAP